MSCHDLLKHVLRLLLTRAGVILAAWIGGLAAAILLLTHLGHGQLAGPPLGGPRVLAAWAGTRAPATLCIALVRFIALAAAWYLLALTLLGIATRLLGLAGVTRLLERLTVPRLRRLVTSLAAVAVRAGAVGAVAAGATVAGTATIASTGIAAAAPAREPRIPPPSTGQLPVMIRLPSIPAASPAPPAASPAPTGPAAPPPAGPVGAASTGIPGGPPPSGGPGDAGGPATPAGTGPVSAGQPSVSQPAERRATGRAPHSAGAAGAGGSSAAPTASATRPGGPVTSGAQDGPGGSSTTAPQTASATQWTVAASDNLWSIASRTLERSWGHAASDPDIDRYWAQLISLNRGVLVVPDDPDLIFPGQVFSLPPVPPGPPGAH